MSSAMSEAIALLTAITECLSKEAKIPDCSANFEIAHHSLGDEISVVASGYGPGKAKNLLSVYLVLNEVHMYIPRVDNNAEFQSRYGFPLLYINSDGSCMTTGKPYHSVSVSKSYFLPLINGSDSTKIRTFLVDSVTNALALRASPNKLVKLQLAIKHRAMLLKATTKK